jgi:hypothetical protein
MLHDIAPKSTTCVYYASFGLTLIGGLSHIVLLLAGDIVLVLTRLIVPSDVRTLFLAF